MKKILLVLSLLFIFQNVYAEDDNGVYDSKLSTEGYQYDNITIKDDPLLKKEAKRKRLVLDKFDHKKWFINIHAGYFRPNDKLAEDIFKYKLHLGIGYTFHDYADVQIFGTYGDGRYSSDTHKYYGMIYDVAALLKARYMVDVVYGEVVPYVGVGAGYTFGKINSKRLADNNDSNKYISSPLIYFKAGFKYTYDIISVGAYVDYSIGLNGIEFGNGSESIKDFSGFGAGVEVGVRF